MKHARTSHATFTSLKFSMLKIHKKTLLTAFAIAAMGAVSSIPFTVDASDISVRQYHRADRGVRKGYRTNLEDKLTYLVSTGHLTNAQKTLLLTELPARGKALRTAMQELSMGQNGAERKKAMMDLKVKHHQDLLEWIKANNINPEVLSLIHGLKVKPWHVNHS